MLEPRLDNRPCGGKYGDIVEAIGNTPLVELKRLSPKPGVRIYAKLESHNPTGSVKDRVARSMIERAEEEGQIGHSPGEQGSNGAVGMALDMAEGDPSYYLPYQYGNPANPDAHYHGTAVEILEELDDVAAFVAGLGTGGTLMGNARRLKEEDPDTLIVAAEPLQGEAVQGLRSLEDGYIPPILDLGLLDQKIFVSNLDAVAWTKRLLEEEGMFVGVSSGVVASIAVRAAGELEEGTSSSSRPMTAGSTSARG